MGGAMSTMGRIGAGIGTFGTSELANEVTGGKLYGNGSTLGGGGGKGGGAPTAPDFVAAAQQQAEAARLATNQQTAANRPDQTNAFGTSSQWKQGPDGKWSQTSSFGGPLGSAADSLGGQVASGMAAPIDFNSLGKMPDPSAMNQAGVDAVYNQETSRLDPQWQQAEKAQRSQLANQGLDPGSEAYDAAAGNFGRARNDAYTSAAHNAITQGSQIGAQLFGEGMQKRQEGAGEMVTQRNQPLSELAALGQFTNQSSASPAGSAAPPNLLGAAGMGWNAANQQYGTEQAGKNSKMNGAATVAPALIAASDERLKTDIERLSVEAVPGVPFARWKWRDGSGDGFGVIAQDVERTRPDLIVFRSDGMRMVNYGALLGAR